MTHCKFRVFLPGLNKILKQKGKGGQNPSSGGFSKLKVVSFKSRAENGGPSWPI